MNNLKNSLTIAITIVAFSIISIFSCTKKIENKSNQDIKTALKPRINIGITFSWKGWGHIVKIKDLDGNVIGTQCPGAGLCDFHVSKINNPLNTNSTNLQEDQNGFYINAVIDDNFPMSELNNFQISEDIIKLDEDGISYTIKAGVYSFNSSINGYRLPVLSN